MKQVKPQNPLDPLYKEVREADSKYGGKKIRKVESDLHKKRQIRDFKKAWEDHEEDFEEMDEFFAD